MRKTLFYLASLVMVVSMVLAACATPTPQVIIQTQVVKEVQTQVVKEVQVQTQVVKEVQTQVVKEVQTQVVEKQVTAAPPTPVPSATIPAPVQTGGEGCDPGATKITWFIGLGAGTNADVVPQEKAWVDKYNKSQKDACILLNIVYNTGQNSYDALRALIAGGNAPDIVGPVGKAGRASFQGAWADVSPLAQAAGFDLSKYDPKLLDFTKDEGVLVGIPFALFPSFIYYNKKLFDEAKLPYPPHKVGEMYNGKPWDLANFQDLAMKLTVDKKGSDATSADFDPKTITQFGFFMQWTDARGVGAFFDGGIPYDPATKAAVIPASYSAAWKWYYDGVWKYHFMPNADYQNSAQFNTGNLFASGNVAMSWVHTWYTCCFDNSKTSWDIAVVPTINGKITAKLHGDTFAILKESKHQDVAFKVLSAMVVNPELAVIYGGMPAVETDRPAFFAALDKKAAPNKVDWTVAEAMLAYPDLPNHESWLPNLAQSNTLLAAFRTLMDQTPLLDLNAAIAKLKADLDAAYKATP
jgi:multiple sugar transport system substrate-binding protein